jgi:hypothetical protein
VPVQSLQKVLKDPEQNFSYNYSIWVSKNTESGEQKFAKKFFNGFEISVKHARNGLKIRQNVYKCVLEFNFASIKVSGLFTFAKNDKIVIP